MANSYEILLNIGGKLTSTFTKSTSGASKGLSGLRESAEKTSKSMEFLKKVTEGFIGFEGIKKVVEIGKDLMDAASDGEQATAQLQAVLKSTGGAAGVTQEAAENLAQSLSGLTTYSKDTVLSSEDLLLTFTKIGKNVMPQATETVLNMSQALGQDTKSSAIQLGKALNDPINGMSALQRVGVTFNASQKAQIKALQQSGNLMGAQKIILKELQTEFGNSAKAAAQAPTGRIQQFKNAWEEVKETVGEKLMPVITSAFNLVGQNLPKIEDGMMGVVNTLTPAFNYVKDTIIPGAGKAISSLMPLLKQIPGIIKNDVIPIVTEGFSIAGGIVKWFGDHLNTVIPIVVGLAGALAVYKAVQIGVNAVEKAGMIIEALGKAWKAASVYIELLQEGEKLAAVAQLALNVAMEANPIGLITAAIVGLAAAAYLIIKHWKPIGQFFEGLWKGVWSVMKSYINLYIDALNLIIKGIDAVTGPLGKVIGVNLKIPEIPKLANGGIVQHRPGGIIANIGEGKYDEAVVPLKNGNGLGGGMNITYAPVYNISGASKEDVKQASAEAQREFARQMEIWQKNKNRVRFA